MIIVLIESCPNSRQIIYDVELSHKGLGLATDFLTTCVIGKLGVLLSGLQESGKTSICDCIRHSLEVDYSLYKFEGIITPAKIGCEDMEEVMTKFNDNNVLWTCTELANTTWEVLDAILRLASGLIDAKFFHYATMTSNVVIDKCNLAYLGCLTLDYLDDLVKNKKWIGNYSQRFLRYYLLPCSKYKTVKITPRFKLKEPVNKTEIEKVIRTIDHNRQWAQLFLMIYGQINEKRAEIMTNNLLAGHALLNGRDKVVKEDYDMLLLHYPNIMAESWFAVRERPSDHLVYQIDELMYFAHCLQYPDQEKRTIPAIADRFHQRYNTARQYLARCQHLEEHNIGEGKNPHRYAYDIKKEYKIWFKIQDEFVQKVIN